MMYLTLVKREASGRHAKSKANNFTVSGKHAQSSDKNTGWFRIKPLLSIHY